MIDRLFALERIGIKLGLENITRLCEALGHPERSFLTVHVAGTNGKGSVTAMVHEILLAAGHRSARYTSPHLSDLRERFVVGSEPVSVALLDEAGRDVMDCADRLVRTGELQSQPTFFEATTAIAFELFRRQQVEIAVIEVGLGGRFDATNVVSPAAGAITSIGFDHQQYLGGTLAAIAFEKAGIIKPGMTLITGALAEEARIVISDVGRARSARVVAAHAGTTVVGGFEDGAARISIRTPAEGYGPVRLGLRGEHQVGNALVAVRLIETLEESGVTVARAAVEHGLSEARWPARLELVDWPGGSRRALIDAAHNPDGARALAAYLARWHADKPPLVIGVMRDKDVQGILEPLLPVVSTVVATAAPTPRALSAAELADEVRRLDPAREVLVAAEPGDALDSAFEHRSTVCVAGSIFLAGAVRDVLKERAILR